MQLRLSATDEILWFVFSGDKHAGPFTSEEFASRANRGEFGDSPYIWTQGMDDWQPLSDFPELETFFLEVKSFAAYRSEEKSDELRLENLVLSMSDKSFFSNEDANLATPTGLSAAFSFGDEADTEPVVSADAPFTAALAVDPTKLEMLRRYRLHVVVLVMIIATAISLAVRSLQESPLLPARDLAKDEYQELRRATEESLQYAGPTAAIGLSHGKPESPSFYITSNVADGAKLELSIEGIPETLINRFRFSMQTVVTLKEHTAKTPPLTGASGGQLEPGAYRIRVRKAGEPTVIAQKVYFLGGAQDLAYEIKLKTHQKNLRNQATLEIMELRQLTETVARQLSDSSMKVTRLFEDLSLSANDRRSKWAQFETLWNQIDSQLNAIAAQWTPHALENEIYYGALYAKLSQAIQKAQSVHLAHAQLFLPQVKRDDVRAVIARESLAAQNLIQELNQKVARLEKVGIKVEDGVGLPPPIE